MNSFANMKIFATIAFCVGATMSAAQADDVKLAKIISVSEGQSQLTRQFFGHVVAKETVELAFQVGGQIVELPITEGGTINRGDLIARLDLEAFELALDRAQVQRDQAVRTFNRLERLQGGAVSQVSVDDAQTQVQIAEIALRDAERSLRNAKLVSPFDGLVAARNVANFITINAGTPVVRLHDMSDLRIEIEVPEVLFQQAGQGQSVSLLAQFPSSQEQYPLAVREFNAETSAVGQTFQITLGMTPPDNLVVLPGSSVTVFATQETEMQSMTIPSSAVINGNAGETQVMVFTPDNGDEGQVKVVPITITPGASGEIIVTSGLEDGQEIVASGANQLSDGDRVRRFTGFAN